MRVINKKTLGIVIMVLVLIEITTLFLMTKSVSNKNVYKEKQEYKTDKKNFAMYVEQSDGTYSEYEDGIYFPTEGYQINLEKSICVDTKENKVEGILRTENDKVTIASNKTVYCNIYFDVLEILDVEFAYTGSYQEYEAKTSGYYYIETYGAKGGSSRGGKGGTSSGYIHLNEGEKIYIFVGSQGPSKATVTNIGGYNGGGYSGNNSGANSYGGGGATDIRYFGAYNPTENDLLWNSNIGLNSRIMVAAGGGGIASNYSSYSMVAGVGGTLIGGSGSSTFDSIIPTGGAQISTGTGKGSNYLGNFGYAVQSNTSGWGGGGGSGYYGGVNGHGFPGSGGSSFISGYGGVNAIASKDDTTNPRTHTNNTLHYSGKYFINGKMESGINEGNGKAKISYIGKNLRKEDKTLDNVRYIKDCTNGSSANTSNHWVELQAIRNGINMAFGKTVTSTATPGTSTNHMGLTGLVDGDIVSTPYIALGTGLQCVTVDLEQNYDLDEVAVWHYYKDERSYNNHSMYVSNDNSNWTTIIDNQSGVAETSNGIRYQTKYINSNSFVINNGEMYTGSKEVKANIYVNTLGGMKYCITESDNSANCTWKNVNANNMNIDYTLSDGDGEKEVYVYLMNPSGNIVDTLTDTIILDTAPLVVPSQSESLAYTGSSQSPTWNNYDSNKMEISGTTSGTNSGTYNVTFTPKGNFMWSDGTNEAKTVSWKINKAAGSLTLSASSGTINGIGNTKTFTVTKAGDGEISVSSSNTGVATVSISGTTVTIKAVAAGSATITVSVSEGTNYTIPSSKTYLVTTTAVVYLYNRGTWNTSLTGSLVRLAQPLEAGTYGDKPKWDLSGERIKIWMDNGGSGTEGIGGSVYWEKPIDLTNYSKIIVEGRFDAGAWSGVAVWSSMSGYVHTNRVRYIDTLTNEVGTIDISSLRGSYYIGFWVYYHDNKLRCFSLRLE